MGPAGSSKCVLPKDPCLTSIGTTDGLDLGQDGAEDELRYHDAPAELLALGSLGKGNLGITL